MRLLEQLEIPFGRPAELRHADHVRLGRQRSEVWAVMLTGRWLTLAEIEEATGAPQASASARLRDLRRPKYGGHTVARRKRQAGGAQWEYRLTVRVEP